MWSFIFINLVLSVARQEVSALAQQFTGGLLSFCVSQMSLLTREKEKRGGESAAVTHCRTGEKSQQLSGGRLRRANAHSPRELLSKLLWDETAKQQMQMVELDKQKHPANKNLGKWIQAAPSQGC